VKLNKSGIYLPLILQFLARRSSKNGCIRPAKGFNLFIGEYVSILDMKSNPSALIFYFQKTFFQSYFFNYGNLVSSALGFISAITERVGVPKTLIIYTS